MVSALEPWVETGRRPTRIVASHSTDGKVDRTRPLCAYPQVARYSGTGSIDAAELRLPGAVMRAGSVAGASVRWLAE